MRSSSLILVLFLALLPAPVHALQEEDLPVRVTADVFRYDRRTRTLTATGHVVLIADDITIRADELIANLSTGEVRAEGDVRLEVAGQTIRGELLSYNLTTRLGTLYNAATTYTGPLVLGPVTLRAARLEGDPARFATGFEAFATTCDPDDPLVSFTAAEIGVIVGDKIVGRRVSVRIGDRRLFTLPYFIIFLRERRESRLAPVVGYSEAEGWFVKTAYSYSLSSSHYGILHADWMERLGLGLGIEHAYRIADGRGTALAYRLANRQTGGTDLRGVLAHAHQLTRVTQATLFADYFGRSFEAASPTSSFFTAFDLNRQDARSGTALFGAYSQTAFTSGAPDAFLTATLIHRQQLGERVTLDVLLPFSRFRSTFGQDDEMMPRLGLSYVGPRYFVTLVGDGRWDLDADGFTGDARYSIERLPELTAALIPFRLGGTSLAVQIEGGVGRFRETTVGTGLATLEAVRTDALVTVTGPVPIGRLGTLGLRAFTRGSMYSTGDGRLYAGGRLQYTHRFTDRFEGRAGYGGQTVRGTTPFLFDAIVGTTSTGDLAVVYRSSRLLLGAETTYDFQSMAPGPVTARALYAPGASSLGTALVYNPILGQIDRVEASLDLRLGREWRVEYFGYYDGLNGRIVHDRVSVSRIFCDCLGVSLTHLGLRNETWLEVWLTAIPWGRGRIGVGGRGGLLFDQPALIGPQF